MQKNKKNIDKGRPGSSCPRKFVALNKEFKDKGICTASREYQYLKIKQLEKEELAKAEFEKKLNKITEKSCTCVGLGTAALLVHNVDTKVEGKGVSVCPGPNMAYFSKVMSLKNITDHIYGRSNMILREDRPNMFIKELNIYIDYLRDKLSESTGELDRKQKKYFNNFIKNMNGGVAYYQSLFESLTSNENYKLLHDLKESNLRLQKVSAVYNG